MKLLQNIVLFFLVFNIVGSTLTIPLVHLDFELRRDYIAKVLCINRAKPMTTCGGQCFLDKQLKKAAENHNKEPQSSSRMLEISFFNQGIKTLSFRDSFDITDLNYSFFYFSDHTKDFIGDFFRPPRYS